MIARFTIVFAVSLCFATLSLGADPEPEKGYAPRKLPQAVPEQSPKLSALDHLRIAIEQLEAAGLANDAVKLREVSDQLNQRIIRERAELARKITALQKQSKQLQLLTGRPEKILCRCHILELSKKAAAEFAETAERVVSPNAPQNPTISAVAVYKNGETVIEQLKKSGKVKVVHASPHIVTTPSRPATYMSGGKMPILVPAGDNGTSVEWKRFGIHCKVEPRWLDSGKIQLKFNPEISNRDFKNVVKVNGITVPGLTVRRVNTTVEMNLGETLVVRTVSPSRESQVKTANAESEAAPSEKTVTLFMVTPVAFD